MKKRDEQKNELDFIFNLLDERGRKLLLLFARKLLYNVKRTV